MDDILFCQQEAFNNDSLTQLSTVLARKGLVVAPEKVQQSTPWKYLGWRISDAKIQPQKVELATNLHTLTDVQTLLGDIQWVRNCAGISNADIAPLTLLLRGSHPSTAVTLSLTQQTALQHIVQKLQTAWTAKRLLTLPVSLLICNPAGLPYALVCQWQNKKGETHSCTASLNSPDFATDKPITGDDPFYILEWMFLSVQPKTSTQTRSETVGELIRKGRTRIVEISGEEPQDISILVKAADLEWWLRHALPIQEALLGYGGRIHSRQPKGRLWQFLKRNLWLEKSRVQKELLAEGITVYTDAGRRLCKAVCVWQEGGQWCHHMIQGQDGDSLQILELTAVVWALTNWLNEPSNFVTDSLYVAGIVPRILDALLREAVNPRLGKLFIQLRTVLSQRAVPCCIIHVRSHQWDLGLGTAIRLLTT